MKTFNNSFKGTHWFYSSLVLLVCLSFLIIPSCQKEEPDEGSAPDMDLMSSQASPNKPKFRKDVTDIDGNIYKTVKIGKQLWMAENLRTTRYQNGDLIGTTTPATLDISTEITPRYQWAYDGDESNVTTYGRLYTWFVASDSRNVCPAGWRVPTFDEWLILYDPHNTVASETSGAQLMEIGTTHWNRPDISGTNETGFTALPGGIRSIYGTFRNMTNVGEYWSSQESPYLGFALYYPIPVPGTFGLTPSTVILPKEIGLSIRCLKDE
jgi:uncharacterized protein (TIGR02145 family)